MKSSRYWGVTMIRQIKDVNYICYLVRSYVTDRYYIATASDTPGGGVSGHLIKTTRTVYPLYKAIGGYALIPDYFLAWYQQAYRHAIFVHEIHHILRRC